MIRLVVPASFPFGVQNTEVPLEFDFDSNLIRIISKKTVDPLKFRVRLEKDITVTDVEINHGGLIIPPGPVRYFRIAHEKPENLWQVVMEIDTEKLLGEFEKDLKFLVPIFLQSIFNIFGYARVSPIIQNEDGSLLFNSRLANLTNPGQDWFAISNLLQFSFDRRLYDQAAAIQGGFSSEAQNYYSNLNELLLSHVGPLDWGAMTPFTQSLANREVFSFGMILAEISQQHPGEDYIPMIGLLTSFIEGLLKINGEHRYKFGIKLSNLFNNPALAPIARKIYDSRSNFAHTGVAKTPNDIFEFIRIEFLLLSIKKIFQHHMSSPIAPDSFDFPIID